MASFFGYIKKELKKLVSEGEYEMPSPLVSKYRKFIFLGIAIIAVGVVITIVNFSALSDLVSLLFSALLGGILICVGLGFRSAVTHNGYDTKEGICIDHQYANIGQMQLESPLSFKKYISSLTIECEDEVVKIPVARGNKVVPLGCKARIYLPKDVSKYDSGEGMKMFSRIYGYEIIPDNEDEETGPDAESADESPFDAGPAERKSRRESREEGKEEVSEDRRKEEASTTHRLDDDAS